jgi:hypothetical protein
MERVQQGFWRNVLENDIVGASGSRSQELVSCKRSGEKDKPRGKRFGFDDGQNFKRGQAGHRGAQDSNLRFELPDRFHATHRVGARGNHPKRTPVEYFRQTFQYYRLAVRDHNADATHWRILNA